MYLFYSSLEEQQRIVDILDRFDALTSSLSEGLPAELAARRSQYEYYRDQLLTFPARAKPVATRASNCASRSHPVQGGTRHPCTGRWTSITYLNHHSTNRAHQS